MFHNINLPDDIAIFASGVSEFSTSIATSRSCREIRKSDTQSSRKIYILKECRLSHNQFHRFHSFFLARMGRRFGFRMKDYCDYKSEKEIIFIGDGKSKDFQLKKTYEDLIFPYTRYITKPVEKTVEIWVENNKIKPNQIDYKSGIVSLDKPPEKSSKVLASFEFDVPVRFMKDTFQHSFRSDGTISLDNIELMEVKE